MSIDCAEDGCLIASEGICARTGGMVPCEQATPSLEDEIAKQLPVAVEPIAERITPTDAGIFAHPGTELGTDDASELMGEYATFVIGIVGFYGSGKTSFLNALYLLASCGDLSRRGYSFAGSLTLPGFEERARASRKWVHGEIPDKMSIRTRIAEGRSAGFVHKDLLDRKNDRRIRILLSDIPGEWASNLIDNVRHAPRFQFLARSDAIFLMVEGSQISTIVTRHVELHRQKMLLDRISSIAVIGTPVYIVVTKADEIDMAVPAELAKLVAYAESKGFSASGHLIASLSKLSHVPSGTGVMDLLINAIERAHTPSKKITAKRSAGRNFGWLPIAQGEMK